MNLRTELNSYSFIWLGGYLEKDISWKLFMPKHTCRSGYTFQDLKTDQPYGWFIRNGGEGLSYHQQLLHLHLHLMRSPLDVWFLRNGGGVGAFFIISIFIFTLWRSGHRDGDDFLVTFVWLNFLLSCFVSTYLLVHILSLSFAPYEGPDIEMEIIWLQKGQSMFSHPHWKIIFHLYFFNIYLIFL